MPFKKQKKSLSYFCRIQRTCVIISYHFFFVDNFIELRINYIKFSSSSLVFFFFIKYFKQNVFVSPFYSIQKTKEIEYLNYIIFCKIYYLDPLIYLNCKVSDIIKYNFIEVKLNSKAYRVILCQIKLENQFIQKVINLIFELFYSLLLCQFIITFLKFNRI